MASKNRHQQKQKWAPCSKRITVLCLFIFILLLFWSISEFRRSRGIQHMLNSAVASLESHGEVVFDEHNGTVERLFICLKQVHSGISTAPIILRDDRNFELFFQHQNTLRTILDKELKQSEIGNVHFFLEGFIGEQESWPSETNEVLTKVAEIDKALSSARRRSIVLDSIKESASYSPEKMNDSLSVLSATGLFASYCYTKGYPVIHRADPPNHAPLTETVHALLQSLVKKDPVTDSHIMDVIAQIQKNIAKDGALRHSYLLKKMQLVPKGGIGIILLGAGHFASGANYPNDVAAQPLELALASLPNARTVVFDERHLSSLLTEPARQTVMIGKNITPEQVRLYIQSKSK